jgi:hypothetical protein
MGFLKFDCFNLVGNATNGDDSVFEVWVQLKEYRVEVGE